MIRPGTLRAMIHQKVWGVWRWIRWSGYFSPGYQNTKSNKKNGSCFNRSPWATVACGSLRPRSQNVKGHLCDWRHFCDWSTRGLISCLSQYADWGEAFCSPQLVCQVSGPRPLWWLATSEPCRSDSPSYFMGSIKELAESGFTDSLIPVHGLEQSIARVAMDCSRCCCLVDVTGASRHGLQDSKTIFSPDNQASQPAKPISLIILISLNAHL